MVDQNRIEGLILGGTELPFILKKEDFKGFPLLNTTDIHIDSILEYALQNS
jgi:aspartate racemase